ncbi:3-hydroxyacyl-CoA dehydrogenase [Ramlibacter sp. AW1]|uniref:3-hydroxyacyl-CoA dehydrogenase n=1 Tax=Ramlibacter aurantiacus TaxID=2801330 RepID=A0A937D1R4_9BURK|nr:3-hydroxyacyl-CoA dehydrogenase [Ramlibacter aurantiacus]MBL0420799.1 3-hydroxyacyl-CoA dehydrogenase [Ramlibacter aurantiacus]
MAEPIPLPRDRAVLVIGAGTMGSGIAEVAAAAGHLVYLSDTGAAAIDRGLGLVRSSLERRVQRGKLTAGERDAVLARLRPGLPDGSWDAIGLAIEAICEDLEAKVSVFAALADRLPPDAILATNTSSLSVTALAGRLGRPERVVGMHFFNPAPTLPLVEVVSGHATSPQVAAVTAATARAWGKTPVACRSTPGFIVNRVARPFYGEALRLLQEQAAGPATLDAVMRECGGFRMGPCELMDLIGHDVNFAVTRSVYEAFFQDARYKPSLVQKDLVDAGWLGRKSGRGFFDYAEEAAPVRAEEFAGGPPPGAVCIEGDLGPAQALAGLIAACPGLAVERRPGDGLLRVDGLALALSDGRTATERAGILGEPVVLFDLALDYADCSRVALAASQHAGEAGVARAAGLFAALGKRVSVLADVPGMAVMRTVSMLVNEAAEALYQGVASEEDVDAAMCMGVNYPLGPLAWGRRIGLPLVLQALRHLSSTYAEDRYRACVWLQRAVQAEGSA